MLLNITLLTIISASFFLVNTTANTSKYETCETFNIQQTESRHSPSETQYYLFIYTWNPERGDTDPAWGVMHWYSEGTVVELTAYPDEDYNFYYWEYDPTPNYSNPIYVTMNQNWTIFVWWSWDVTIRAFDFYAGGFLNIYFELFFEPYPDQHQ